jgi:hypothetical protein
MLSSTTIDRLRNSLWSGSRHSTFVNSWQNGSSHIRFFSAKRGEMRATKLADREPLPEPLARFFVWTSDGFVRDALPAFLPNLQKWCTTIRFWSGFPRL